MNRRDIIIIAVLLNTGLLSALVMMAIQTESDQFVQQSVIAKAPTEFTYEKEEKLIADNSSLVTDEWDNVLKDYVSSNSSEISLHEDEANEDLSKVVEEPKKMVKEVSKPKNNSKTIEITVKKGDALEKIARANGITIDEIRALNNLKNDRLVIGQTLLIPAETVKPEVKTAALEPAKTNSSSEHEYYVIKSGDNPWKIAKQFKVKFDDLLKMNHLDEEKARNLKIGDKIRVK